MTTFCCPDCRVPWSENAEEDPTYCPHCGEKSAEKYEYEPRSDKV